MPLAAVRELPAPSGARVKGSEPDPEADRAALLEAAPELTDVAAALIDYSQGGIYHQPHYQDQLAALTREAGALWFADGTVTAFGRVGHRFQFQAAESRPDIVTMGKGLAAGGSPAGAAVLSRELLERMEEGGWQSYSSYRAHPVEGRRDRGPRSGMGPRAPVGASERLRRADRPRDAAAGRRHHGLELADAELAAA
jgi:adenosylmethionine-8-amino-7-oxononanoate aminotransferase